MPRIARDHEPGSLIHLISSFAHGVQVMDLPGARSEYLSRVPSVLHGTDWIPLAYALMGTHLHWALLAGRQPSRTFHHPLHTGFALWVNRRLRASLVAPGRRFVGPVFADRPRTFVVEDEALPRLIAYLHNNPVRAGIVAEASGSDWTSHRQYCDPASRKPWLACRLALERAGFGDLEEGRRAFSAWTADQAGATGRWFPADDELRWVRREARRRSGAPAELGTPRVSAPGSPRVAEWSCAMVTDPIRPVRLRWEGSIGGFLSVVSRVMGIEVAQMLERDRRRDRVRARRLAVHVWTRRLNRPLVEVADALGITASAALQLLTRGPRRVQELHILASEVEERCWCDVADGGHRSEAVGRPRDAG